MQLHEDGGRPPTQMNFCLSSGHVECLDGSSRTLNDELLVLAAKSGDTAAFAELRRRHSSKVLKTVNRINKNWEDAEDALQDSFLRVSFI